MEPSEAARILGRLGGAKGGAARVNKLPQERRVEIASNAAQSRWDQQRQRERQSMIFPKMGDILNSNAEVLVNAVNCAGAMGKGLALQFAKKFPAMEREYIIMCRRGLIKVGAIHAWPFEDEMQGKTRWIYNFPTKEHWSRPSYLDYIKAGLEDLVRLIQTDNIKSIAIPRLGCGLGGLDWKDVKPLIESAMAQVPNVLVELFE